MTDQREIAEAAEAALRIAQRGQDIQKELVGSPTLTVVLAYFKRVRNTALRELAVVDPSDTKLITELQVRAGFYTAARGAIQEAIQQGEAAAQQVMGEDGMAEDDYDEEEDRSDY